MIILFAVFLHDEINSEYSFIPITVKWSSHQTDAKNIPSINDGHYRCNA